MAGWPAGWSRIRPLTRELLLLGIVRVPAPRYFRAVAWALELGRLPT